MHNYFSENARIKFIPIDADVSGVVMEPTPNLICYGLVDWLIRYPMTAVVTVVFTSCPTRGGQQRNQFKIGHAQNAKRLIADHQLKLRSDFSIGSLSFVLINRRN